MERTNYAGLITKDFVGQEVKLYGWVQKRRDKGGLIFVDLRDIQGVVQLTFNAQVAEDAHQIAQKLRNEFVITVEGVVQLRDSQAINPNLATGEVEVVVNQVQILAESKTPPFEIEDSVNANEDLKLKYRYLDLRRPEMQKSLILRSQIMMASYSFMQNHGFINIETPILAKSTPEGARDYLVPSRIYKGSFYALPQSPQIFKQLLMGAGFDRYFQIAKAFRDEDLRGDRQPEFTQMDVETSFMDQEQIIDLVNDWITEVFSKVLDIEIDSKKIPVMTYQESIDRFGTDKPDLRINYQLIDISDFAKNCQFTVFNKAVENGGVVKAIVVPNAAEQFSRKDIDNLTDYIKRYDAKGLAWIKIDGDRKLTGPIAKFFENDNHQLLELLNAKPNDLVLFVADDSEIVNQSLDYLRRETARITEQIDDNWSFAWIVDWPLFEYSKDFDRWISAHHPFTMPNVEDLHYLDDGQDPHKAHAQSYDLVLNGYELGSGSIRINTPEIQNKMLKALGFTPEDAQESFGFLLEGMEYGFPPMGGIAIGLDRLAMLMANRENIRDVIAFPKNSKATEPMTQAPTKINQVQLDELGINAIDEQD